VKPKELLFELDGKGLTPETVDTLALLRLAEEWFRLAVKTAEASHVGLSFSGLRIREKCVAVAATPSDYGSARRATAKVLRMVAGKEDVSRGTETLVRDFRKDLRSLPAGYSAHVRLGKEVHKLTVASIPLAERPWERIELRVRPIRVGGQEPTVLLVSQSEAGPFTVETTIANARKLGAALHEDIDVTLDVCRGPDGQIAEGRVVEVFQLEDGNAVSGWRDWFAENASEWNDVGNVLDELDRIH
jgi:hypothetical protein